MSRRSWAFLIVAALAVTACEGPEGPTGPAGSTGAAGAAGPDGTQGTVLAGVGAFEFTGSEDIDGGPFVHATGDACGSCHMGAAFGEQAGCHTWKMTYDYHGHEVDNVAGCTGTGCHSSMDDFADKGDIPAQVSALITAVETELIRLGIHSGSGHYAVKGEWSGDLAAAFVNYQLFAEDRSMGLHNPPYAVSVLTNTLETLQGM